MKQEIKAEILCDSIERIGNNRITTWKLTYPRFIHAEVLTHKMLQSNSASSRAIPFKRMVEMVENDSFIPIKWMKEHKGMQGIEYFEDIETINRNIEDWLYARDNALENAQVLSLTGVTKQICNRLLEPFLWHTIILTGTEFENFFALRAHPMAEIHLQDLAYKMLDAYNANIPQELKESDWHIPFQNELNEEAFLSLKDERNEFPNSAMNFYSNTKIKIATAKCAQVSYLKFGSDDYEDLIDLHDSLVIRPYNGKRGIREIGDPIHASPAVHCAQAMTEEEYNTFVKGQIEITHSEPEYEDLIDYDLIKGWCHSFRGFKSYRSMLPNENSTDSRVIKK